MDVKPRISFDLLAGLRQKRCWRCLQRDWRGYRVPSRCPPLRCLEKLNRIVEPYSSESLGRHGETLEGASGTCFRVGGFVLPRLAVLVFIILDSLGLHRQLIAMIFCSQLATSVAHKQKTRMCLFLFFFFTPFFEDVFPQQCTFQVPKYHSGETAVKLCHTRSHPRILSHRYLEMLGVSAR